MIDIDYAGLTAAVESLGGSARDECGWFSDGQMAEPYYNEEMRSVEFCGEGSIDLQHVAEDVIRAYLKEARNA